MNRLLRVLALVAFGISFVLVVSGTQAKETKKKKPNVCTKDKPCPDCGGFNACQRVCEGGGCAFKASGAGAANFLCTDGNCTMDHSGAGQAVLHCAGGGCKATCTGLGECKIVDCKKDCAVDCQGAGKCSGGSE